MGVRVTKFGVGDLIGTTFVFEKAGDEVPAHFHTLVDVHITVIRRGKIQLFGRPSIEGMILNPGDLVDWEPYELHGFRAVTDDARVDNIRKNYHAHFAKA